MRLIVTRPKREASQWALELSAQGRDAVALPLIRIGPVPDPVELQQAWQHLADYVGVMFVSAAAVTHFFDSKHPASPVFTAQTAIQTRAWATGPGTAAALKRAGVAPRLLDAPPLEGDQFDSEALWQVVRLQVQPADRVLIVRGDTQVTDADPVSEQIRSPVKAQGSGRDWLATQVLGLGAQVDFVVAYQRSVPVWSTADYELARLAASDDSVWLFSSAQALVNLSILLPQQSWSRARAIATHPRIATAVRKAGFAQVNESRPTLADVLRVCCSLNVR
jgi:uroporphyrinogen-III synthase